MAIHADGALGATFKITRALQAACMIAIIGMTSNFISQMVSANATPPSILIGIISIICIAVLYCVITFILYLDNLLSFLINSVVDVCFLITLVVVGIVLGKPLSYLECSTSSPRMLTTLGNSIVKGSKFSVDYEAWIGSTRSICLEMKSIWGLCVALCILFFLSAAGSLCLWRKNRIVVKAVKGEA